MVTFKSTKIKSKIKKNIREKNGSIVKREDEGEVKGQCEAKDERERARCGNVEESHKLRNPS